MRQLMNGVMENAVQIAVLMKYFLKDFSLFLEALDI